MTDEHCKAKRWRPRWSIRLLLIVVALLCAYLACWGPTEQRGVSDVADHLGMARNTDASADLPLIVGVNRFRFGNTVNVVKTIDRSYYIWFFGYVAKLPVERLGGQPARFRLVIEIPVWSR